MRSIVAPALRKLRQAKEDFISFTPLASTLLTAGILLFCASLAYLAVLMGLLASPVFPWPAPLIDRLLAGLFISGFIAMMSGLFGLIFSTFAVLYLLIAWAYQDRSAAFTGLVYLAMAALCAYEFFTGTLNQLVVESLLPVPDYMKDLEKALLASPRS